MSARAFALTVLALALVVPALAADSARTTGAACAPGYRPCLPVRGDLDCDEIDDALKPIRSTGADQYALDRDGDGLACEVSGQGGGARSPWGLILRKPPRKEATSAKVGDMPTVVGWSPASTKGERYELCVHRVRGVRCVRAAGPLQGVVQRLGTWKVARTEGRKGVFRMSLRVKGRVRTFDTVPLAR